MLNNIAFCVFILNMNRTVQKEIQFISNCPRISVAVHLALIVLFY